jgi:hypothetical protein
VSMFMFLPKRGFEVWVISNNLNAIGTESEI